MKNLFNSELNSNYVTTRRRNKFRFFLVAILVLAIAGYFIVPKIIKFFSNIETEIATISNNPKPEPAAKEQIIKVIPLPNLEETKTTKEVKSEK